MARENQPADGRQGRGFPGPVPVSQLGKPKGDAAAVPRRTPASIFDVLSDELDGVRERADTMANQLAGYQGVPPYRMLKAAWGLQKAQRQIMAAWNALDGEG
jgi:hypothetical protein